MAKKTEMPPPPLPNIMKDILPLPGEKDKMGVANPKPEDVQSDPLVVDNPPIDMNGDPPRDYHPEVLLPVQTEPNVWNPDEVNSGHHHAGNAPRKPKNWEPPRKS